MFFATITLNVIHRSNERIDEGLTRQNPSRPVKINACADPETNNNNDGIEQTNTGK